ncbi:protein-disulfide reductase DsbD domain-containing protein [Pollutibacter soli]|uniref:protein-disulfide reductase DsbD domain-containing protein n=1 Tax=Pollutibacter soli TaxID=3034157 RepID=UPI003013B5E2
MTKKILLISTLILSVFGAAFAQTGSAKQVKWTFTSKKIADNTYEVRLTADISGNYHMYAQKAGVDGPVPTTINFTANPLLSLNGDVKESGKLIKKFESAWSGDVNYYEKTVEFVQVVKLKTKAKTNINGKVEFMVCNESLCLPPSEVAFKIEVGG